MKKFLLLCSVVLTLGLQPGQAQVSFSADPLSQGPLSPGDSFSVEISLNITGTTPGDVQGFEMIIETIAANSGYFSITGATAAAAGIPTAITSYPDVITTANSSHAGFAQNLNSQGFAFDSVLFTSPGSSLLVTLDFVVNAGTPDGTYNFNTTDLTSGLRASTVSDSDGNTFGDGTGESITPATFSVTVVPEPGTWALLVAGGLGTAGFTALRRRRR